MDKLQGIMRPHRGQYLPISYESRSCQQPAANKRIRKRPKAQANVVSHAAHRLSQKLQDGPTGDNEQDGPASRRLSKKRTPLVMPRLRFRVGVARNHYCHVGQAGASNSAEIGQVLKVPHLSHRNQLLALNATSDASPARGGWQSFAVVATKLRNWRKANCQPTRHQ